jgi:hypothetical protein
MERIRLRSLRDASSAQPLCSFFSLSEQEKLGNSRHA